MGEVIHKFEPAAERNPMYNSKDEACCLNVNAVVCFFAGAAIGAVVTLLYTPQSGRDMRNQIMDRGDNIKHRVLDATSHVTKQIGEVVEDASRKIHDIKENARDAVHSIGQELKEA